MVQLNVGCRKFDISFSSLKADPESLLATLAEMDSPNGGRIHFLDRNQKYFDFALDFLRTENFNYKALPVDKVA
jgi:hypothetical protein